MDMESVEMEVKPNAKALAVYSTVPGAIQQGLLAKMEESTVVPPPRLGMEW